MVMISSPLASMIGLTFSLYSPRGGNLEVTRGDGGAILQYLRVGEGRLTPH
jgi:hypothetical protein